LRSFGYPVAAYKCTRFINRHTSKKGPLWAGAGRCGETGPEQTAAERIKQAKELLAQGLLSKEDYDKKVKEIVDSL
jgi:hypothetical protein